MEYNQDLFLALLYTITKYSTHLKHKCVMLTSLKRQGVLKNFTGLVKEMYSDLKEKIITNTKGEYFEIKIRVKQNDPQKGDTNKWKMTFKP